MSRCVNKVGKMAASIGFCGNRQCAICVFLLVLLTVFIVNNWMPFLPMVPSHPVEKLASAHRGIRFTQSRTAKAITTMTTTMTSPVKPSRDLSAESCPTCHVFDLWSNATYDDFDCVNLNFRPVSKICLYPDNEDIWVSRDLRMTGQWEPGLVARFQSWLLGDPDAGVIDFGTNLGVYSLVAAAMGHDVVSIEPSIHNIRRFHKAVKLSKLEQRVTLLQNAVSDNRGIAQFSYSKDNQGDTQMVIKSKYNRNVTDEETFSKLIVMDDILPFCKFERAVMKIDIQGFEHRAFAHAEKLFDTINIFYVMMEWEIMKVIHQQKEEKPQDFQLVVDMLDFFYSRRYIAKDWRGKVLVRDVWSTWPNDMLWIKQKPVQ